MQTTNSAVKDKVCGRFKFVHFKGKKVYCKGIVKLYPSLAENWLQGVCDTCCFITGENTVSSNMVVKEN